MFPLRENGRIPQNFWQGPEKSLPLMPIFFAYCIVAIPLQCGNSILTENLKFLLFLLVPSDVTRCHCRDAKSVAACPVFLFYNHYPSQMVVAICWMLGVMEQYRAALHSSHYWNDIEVTSTDHPPPPHIPPKHMFSGRGSFRPQQKSIRLKLKFTVSFNSAEERPATYIGINSRIFTDNSQNVNILTSFACQICKKLKY